MRILTRFTTNFFVTVQTCNDRHFSLTGLILSPLASAQDALASAQDMKPKHAAARLQEAKIASTMNSDNMPKRVFKDLTVVAMKSALKPGDCLLGIDLGAKTIGLAVSDQSLMIATPLRALRRTTFAYVVKELQEIVAERVVGGLVIGWPLQMDGVEGSRCQATRSFAANLAAIGDGGVSALPVALWDERLSTAVVQRMMVEEMDLSRKRRAKAVDKVAAAYILQGFLDVMSSL